MSMFRHPKTQNERKADQGLRQQANQAGGKAGRMRSGKKGRGLPTERDDKIPAARADRARGKPSHSPARKAKAKTRDRS